MKLYLSTVVWGQDYIDKFINYTLPSLLTDGNLKSNKIDKESIFSICCDEDEQENIINNKNFKILEKYINVQFFHFKIKLGSKYKLVSRIQEALFKNAYFNRFEYFMFVYPDSVYSNNTIDFIYKKILEEYDNVLIPGPLVSKEYLDDKIGRKKFEDHGLSNQELADIIFYGLHPFYKMLNYKYINILRKANAVFFNKVNNAYLFSGFNLHPLVIRLFDNHKKVTINQSFDGDDLRKILINTSKTYFVQNSTEIVISSIESIFSDRSKISNKQLEEAIYHLNLPDDSIKYLTGYAEEYTNTFQREFFLSTYILYNSNYDSKKEEDILRKKNKNLDNLKINILTNLLIPDSILKKNNYETYRKRYSNIVEKNKTSRSNFLSIVGNRIVKTGITMKFYTNFVDQTDSHIVKRIEKLKFSSKLILFTLTLTPDFLLKRIRAFYKNKINSDNDFNKNQLNNSTAHELNNLLKVYGKKNLAKSFIVTLIK